MRWRVRRVSSRVSGIDDAGGISAHHRFLSNWAVQVMRVWSLQALLSPLAKLHIYTRYGVTQPTAYHTSHGICGAPGMKYHAPISGCLSSCAGRS